MRTGGAEVDVLVAVLAIGVIMLARPSLASALGFDGVESAVVAGAVATLAVSLRRRLADAGRVVLEPVRRTTFRSVLTRVGMAVGVCLALLGAAASALFLSVPGGSRRVIAVTMALTIVGFAVTVAALRTSDS